MSDERQFDTLIDELEQLVATLQTAAVRGALDAAELIEEDASLTRLYDDQSRATRHSTTAYVVGPGFDGSAILDARASEAQALYESAALSGIVDGGGEAQIEEVDAAGGPDAVTLVLTALMDYDLFLVTMQGGARDFITESMHGNAGQIDALIARQLEEVFR